MIKKLYGLVCVICMTAQLMAAPRANVVTIKGSDTMVILGQRWAEEYMKKHAGTIIQVTGGGSGTGIASLINGSTDIAQASRPMTSKEKDLVKKKRGREVQEIPVAMDGIAIYVHLSNPASEITLTQLKSIFTGEEIKWENIGAKPGQIIAYGRENNSGTYAYFKEHVLQNEDFSAEVLSLPGTAAVVNAVSKDVKAIGYGGIGYSKGVRILKVKKEPGAIAIAPTNETIANGEYPISRYLYFYTAGQAQGSAKAFIDWALGSEGQKICEKVGYFPLRLKNRSAFSEG